MSSIKIPEEIVKQIQLKKDDEIYIQVHRQGLTIQTEETVNANQTVNKSSFKLATVLSVLTFITTLLIFSLNNVRLVSIRGSFSISNVTLLINALFGIFVFALSYHRVQKLIHDTESKLMNWRNLIVLTIAITFVLMLMLYFFFYVVNVAFKSAHLDIFTSSLLIAGFTWVIQDTIYKTAPNIDFNAIITLLSFMFIGGIIFTMLTNSDDSWWQYNFSYLGTSKANLPILFNFTFVFSGITMIASVDYLFNWIKISTKKLDWKMWTIRILMTLFAINLSLIGVFANNGNGWQHHIHDRIAMYLFYIVLILMISSFFLLPGLSKEFIITSSVEGALMAVTFIIFSITSYLSLTAFEMIEFAIAFTWLIQLLQNLRRFADYGNQVYKVKIK